MKRFLRLGCWTFVAAGFGGVQLLVFLYAVASGAMWRAESRPRKTTPRRNPPGLMLDAGSDFMKDFYARLFRQKDPIAAFHETQRAELARWKRLEGVEAAARQAGVFVIAR